MNARKRKSLSKKHKEAKNEEKIEPNSNLKLYLLILTLISVSLIYYGFNTSNIERPSTITTEPIKGVKPLEDYILETSKPDPEEKSAPKQEAVPKVIEKPTLADHGEEASQEEIPPPSRIVAIGDLHGDFPNAIKTLKMASLIDSKNNWIGKTTILVQTGDIVDRGPDTIILYRLFQKLAIQASEVGGQVIVLLGNHEILNLGYDWRYVPPEDIASFGGVEERIEAWSLKGWIGKYLNTLNMTANVNGTVFFHAGANLDFSKLGIKGINKITSNVLKNTHPLQYKFQSIFGDEGPVWFRGYALQPENVVCKELKAALKNFKARRMVIGHTPQMNGVVLSRCEHLVYVIDVGISRVYGGHSAALEIIGDQVSAIYPTKTVKLTEQ